MRASGFKLLCLAVALYMSSIGLCADEKYYRAAVHEICQYNEDSSSDSELINQNMAKYIQAAEISAFEDVDILVYAEKGLFPLRPSNATWFLSYAEDVPSGKERANPCDQEEYSDRPILNTLSCIAKIYNLIIVADLIDKKKCIVSEDCDRTTINYCVSNADECPEDGLNGATYTNWWFDHTPLNYFSVSNQQSYSMENGIAVLSSNVHQPNVGSLGSGIYIPGNGALIYSYNPDGRSKLLISNVPKSNNLTGNEFLNKKFYYIDDNDTFTELYGEEPRYFGRECSVDVLGEEVSSFTDYRCRQTEVDQYTFTKLNDTSGQIDTCSNGFCCSLSYTAESMNEAFYFGVSGYRLKFYETFWFGVQACFLARCEDVDGKPCRNFLLTSDTIFQKVEITGSFETKHIYPHAMDTELRLTNRSEWHFDGVSRMSYESVNQNSLLFLGMYGRVYRRDGLVKQ
ncbi:vascular non-inflammatory molecule 2 [Caerostris darwini]|uniref:Vascular non-inflammatory molecule 2 n=1 Tax=Caerostris darwini TaxID=1538125 RepID=A0AAV4Q169_9ARAC|nr:vascular non-inflammatory molecule 2 [Caerostris darwini]